jgi:hypothetical protein
MNENLLESHKIVSWRVDVWEDPTTKKRNTELVGTDDKGDDYRFPKEVYVHNEFEKVIENVVVTTHPKSK